jgi:hypothetical protein
MVRDSVIGSGTHLEAAIVGEECTVGAGNRLQGGICLYPGTLLADDSIHFTDPLRGREAR